MCCDQVGAQNAGKSSLINAMKRAVRREKPRNELTTAALPGTTLGVNCLIFGAFLLLLTATCVAGNVSVKHPLLVDYHVGRVDTGT